MHKALYNQGSPLKKRHLTSSLDSLSYPKHFHVRNHYYPTSASIDFEPAHTGRYYTLTSKDKSIPVILNGSHEENLNSSQEYARSNENFSSKGELEAVPERSIEYSEVTNKTSNLDPDMFKVRTEPEMDERRYMNSHQTYPREHLELKYEPYLKTASMNFKANSDEDSEVNLSKSYRSPKNRMGNGGNIGKGSREINEKRYAERQERSSSKKKYRYNNILLKDYNENGYMEYDRANGAEREVKYKHNSPATLGSAKFRKSNPEGFSLKESSVGRQSLPEFETRSVERSTDRYNSQKFSNRKDREGQNRRDSTVKDQMEIAELRDKNEKLEERIKTREKRVEEMNRIYEDAYSKYMKSKSELEELRRESEMYRSQKDRLLQLEERERMLLVENETLKQDDSRKHSFTRELEAQINKLKADMTHTNNKYESKVESLKLQIRKLEDEKHSLVHQRRKIDEERSYYQRLEVSVEEEKMSLQRDLEESYAHMKKLTSKNEELVQKVDNLKRINQEKEKTYREKLDESNLESKRMFEESLNQIKEDTSRHFHNKLNHYKAKSEHLTIENENLKLELDSRPTLRKFKENEAKLYSLENELEQTKQSVVEHRKKISEVNMPAKILKDISDELELTSIGEIIPTIREILQDHKVNSKFINTVLDLVYNCTPKGYFDGRPTLKQAWKWLKSILEEYMNIKMYEGQDTGAERQILGKAMEFLRVKDREEVPGKVRQVMISNSLMSQIITKVKEIHKLEWVESLPELERRLDEKSPRHEENRYKSVHYK